MEIFCNGGQFFSDTLLQHIAQKNNAEILSIIQDANPSQLTDSFGETLLHTAASYDNLWLARYLIGLGANVDAQNHYKQTPLIFAIINNIHEVVKALLEADVDIYIPNQHGDSALKVALDCDYNDIFMTLLDCVTSESLRKSKYAGIQSFHVHFPLHYFMPLKEAEVIRALLEQDSPVDARKPDTGDTSLHIAVDQMDLEKAKLLLEYGADVNVKSYAGDTPLSRLVDLSDENKVLAMVKILLTAGATMIDRNSQDILVSMLLMTGTKKIVRYLLEYKIDLQFEDRTGYTPLFYLAQNQNPDILAELRGFDFDVNYCIKVSKMTMLHSAAFNGNVSSVQFLLDRNADVNATCRMGITALQCTIDACRFLQSAGLANRVKCIEILLARGADPRIIKRESFNEEVLDDPVPDAVMQAMNPVLAYLSLVEAVEQEYMYQKILTMPGFQKILKSKDEEREKMRQIGLGDSVTLLDFLRATNQTISLYARNRKLISISNSAMKEYSLDPCFQFKVQESFLKYSKLVELRKKAASTIDEIFTEICNTSIYNVAQKVVEFLEDQELNILV